MEAEAANYSEVYKKPRCDAKHCKSGPHCAVDARGNHYELIPFYIKGLLNMFKKEGNLRDLETCQLRYGKHYQRCGESKKPQAFGPVAFAR